MVTSDLGLTGGMDAMVKTAGLRRAISRDEIDGIDASLAFGKTEDAW